MASRSAAVATGRARGGRGRGRGRGRGQGNSHNTATSPRPTHFLAVPIGHHRDLRNSVNAFQSALLHSSPAIPGLDSSICIHPRRLHLTLGVMSLDSTKTLQSALNLLQSLRPEIMRLLGGETLRVALNQLHIMNPERARSGDAHVLWVGPALVDGHARRLKNVCDFVHAAFKANAFVVENRPLKLHCTILNTSHRQGPRRPFSYPAVLASPAFRTISTLPLALGMPSDAVPVNLGVWVADEIQICIMGSHGPENEYIACGGIQLSNT